MLPLSFYFALCSEFQSHILQSVDCLSAASQKMLKIAYISLTATPCKAKKMSPAVWVRTVLPATQHICENALS